MKVPLFSAATLRLVSWSLSHKDLGTFQTVAFMLYLRVSGSMSEYFKNGFSISYSSMVSLVLIPIDFQNQTYWELVSTGVGVPDVGAQCLHSSKESSIILGSLPNWGTPHLGWHPRQDGVSASHTCLLHLFYFFVEVLFI